MSWYKLFSAFTTTSSPSQVTITPSPASSTSIPIESIPKMERLLNMGNIIAGEIINYSGDMKFLDDQKAFFKTFGDNRAMMLYKFQQKRREGGTIEII